MRRLLLPLCASLLLLAVTACDPSSGDPAKVKFAPALGVDLAAMNRSDTGLYTQDTVEGTDAAAVTGDYVTVHYTGWLPDGSKFDSSHNRDQPFSFMLGMRQVIKGWDEGVAGMKAGGQRRLVIPSDLAYGQSGRGSIPPNSVLIFDVEMLSISSGDPAKVKFAPALGVDLAAMNRSDTGLYTQDTVEGTGATATRGNKATVHYTGWLPDGSKFDSSHDRDEPFSFTLGVGQVIKGWDEGVASMKAGGQRRLVIPSDLAYGQYGRGAIPPNAVLIFDVELLSVP
jgi:FKBP-type peptidyl-prolyl cis-trans isomerase